MANGTRQGRASTRRHPRAGGRHKIDWNEARSLFVRDVTLGFGDIARTFGVSEMAVRNHAHARCRCCPKPWEDLRAEAVAKVEAKRRIEEIRSLEERQADTIRVAEKLRRRVLSVDDTDIDLTAAVRTTPRYATLEQLYAGEATDRIAIAEVQTLFEAGMRAARTVLEEALSSSGLNGKRGAVLAYFDEALPNRIAELTQGADD